MERIGLTFVETKLLSGMGEIEDILLCVHVNELTANFMILGDCSGKSLPNDRQTAELRVNF
jgi:hypothetical protein